MNIRKLFSSRRFQYGAMSSAITLAALALVIVLNVVMSVLSDKFPITVDLTPDKAFNLTSSSVEYAKGLEKPVNVSVLANENQLTGGGDVYYTQIKSIIDQYQMHSKHITVEYIDIIADPTFAAKHDDQTLNYGDILITSGDKTRKLSINDMFNVQSNPNTGRQVITSSKAEQMMTAAIMGVTSESLVKAGIVMGQGEIDMPALQNLLTQNNFELAQQSLSTGEIDPTLDVLFLLAPTRDPDEEALKRLDTFLENGGLYGKSLIYAANIEQPVLPNLEAFLADWGISVPTGAVLETDANKVFNYNQFFCTVEYTAGDYTADIPSGIKASMPFGRPLQPLFESQGGYTTSVLLSYSDTACVMPLDADENWQPTADKLGAIPAGIRSSYTHYEGATPQTSNVFAFSAISAFESALLDSSSVSNAEYFVNLLNTVTNREDVVTIAPKTLGGSELGITQLQATLLSALLIYVLPFVIVVVGIIIWLRRRHK